MYLKKILLLCVVLGLSVPGLSASSHFLALSDIHFDPFAACKKQECTLLDHLEKAPITEWDALLSGAQTEIRYGEDTNISLLKQSLVATKKEARHHRIKFVVLLGDFLRHDFKSTFFKFSKHQNELAYQAFVKKTFAFLQMEIQEQLADLKLFPVLGNNDSIHKNYYFKEHDPFYRYLKSLWSVNDENFLTGGYYAADLAPNLKLIALNSVIWSVNGKNNPSLAKKQLAWLHHTLTEVKRQKQKALVIMHIPSGVDVFATLKIRLAKVKTLWHAQYAAQFQEELRLFAPQIMGVIAGHLHADWFQVLESPTKNVAISGVPAISPMFGNNPGFKVYTYQHAQRDLINFETFFQPLNANTSFIKEYNFNHYYNKHCTDCSLVTGMQTLFDKSSLGPIYTFFYAVSTYSQPITEKQNWYPYYWCAIKNLTTQTYTQCVSQA